MRSIVLLTLLALSAPALAQDGDAASQAQATRDVKAEYATVIELVDAWFKARESDQQRQVVEIDEKLGYWYKRELGDDGRMAELAPAAPAGKKKKGKRNKSAPVLSAAADGLDDETQKDYARLRAVTQELADMQPSFERMEANAVMYLNKGRKLRELQALAQAELRVEKAPAPVAAAPVAAAPAKAGSADAVDAPAKAVDEAAAATEKAAEKAKEAPPKAPARKPIEILDE